MTVNSEHPDVQHAARELADLTLMDNETPGLVFDLVAAWAEVEKQRLLAAAEKASPEAAAALMRDTAERRYALVMEVARDLESALESVVEA